VRQIEAIAAELDQHEEQYNQPMSAVELKQAHFAAYSVSHSRDSQGKSRKGR
jgi:hypothetical protein